MDETRSFYQVQYFWVEHVNPMAFFGYILALEGMAVKAGPRAYAAAEKAHGKGACTFLKVHAMEDVDHVAEAFKHLETLDGAELAMVVTNFNQSCTLYSNMMHEIASRAGVGFERQAA